MRESYTKEPKSTSVKLPLIFCALVFAVFLAVLAFVFAQSAHTARGVAEVAQDSTDKALAISDSLLGVTQEARDSTNTALDDAEVARDSTV